MGGTALAEGDIAVNGWLTRTFLATGIVLGVLSGCATPPKQSPSATVRSDVAKVICLYDVDPFLSFDEAGDPEVEGFRVTVVLASRKTGKGIAADGALRARMYRVDRFPPKKPVRTLVREWPPVETADQTTFKSGALGDGYILLFQWAEEDDVLGHDVDIVMSFEGPDGRVVRSQTKSLKVPPAKSR